MSPNVTIETKKFEQPERRVETALPVEQPREREGSRESGRHEQQPQETRSAREESFGVVTAPVPQTKNEESSFATADEARIAEIERVLSEHVEDLYSSLPQSKQREFKNQGEETAQRINTMFQQAKVRVKEILRLIISWLSLVPGISKFFIEQQAEIKMNKLLALHDSSKRKP